MNRTIAIGDIHGCSLALAAIIKAIDLKTSDTLVTLGDYVDRGIDTKGVLDQLIMLQHRCRLIPILGNHDQMMLGARKGPSELELWYNFGGQGALASYGFSGHLNLVPKEHYRFLESCLPYFETDTHFFLHANYKPEIPLDQLDIHTLRWLSIRDYVPPCIHNSNKIAFVGHTPHPEVFDLGYLVDIDTRCCKDGWLTAMDVDTKQIWQADERGEMRNQTIPPR